MEIILITLSLIMPFGACAGFYLGFKTAKNIYSFGDIPGPFFQSGGYLPRAESETDRERIGRLIAGNIENYGTDIPQVEVR